MQVFRVHYNLKMCKVTGMLLQIVKSERKKTVFYSNKNETYMYFLDVYIFGPFWEDVSGEIKTGSITNLPTIYQNVIYSEVLPPTLGYRMPPSRRN
jgi:hypothetical protein